MWLRLAAGVPHDTERNKTRGADVICALRVTANTDDASCNLLEERGAVRRGDRWYYDGRDVAFIAQLPHDRNAHAFILASCQTGAFVRWLCISHLGAPRMLACRAVVELLLQVKVPTFGDRTGSPAIGFQLLYVDVVDAHRLFEPWLLVGTLLVHTCFRRCDLCPLAHFPRDRCCDEEIEVIGEMSDARLAEVIRIGV